MAKVFDKARRRKTCVHEAGHAVVHALGGIDVHQLVVAPEGSESWEYTDEVGNVHTGVSGACVTAPYPLPLIGFMTWDPEDGSYRTDPDRFAALLHQFSSTLAQVAGTTSPAAIVREYRRLVRAHVCGMLAGRAAAQRHEGEDIEDGWWSAEADDPDDPLDDAAKAFGFARLLRNPSEFSNLYRVTAAVLREADVWAMIQRLADELEQRGIIEDPEELLPPPRLKWPPCPPGRRRTR